MGLKKPSSGGVERKKCIISIVNHIQGTVITLMDVYGNMHKVLDSHSETFEADVFEDTIVTLITNGEICPSPDESFIIENILQPGIYMYTAKEFSNFHYIWGT